MKAKIIPCGPYVNESERRAADLLKLKLLNGNSSGPWRVLTNYCSGNQGHRLSDEIDQIIIGPNGLTVVEVKHWAGAYLKGPTLVKAEQEAEKLNNKVKRLQGKLKHLGVDLGFLGGRFLFTANENERFVTGQQRRHVRGIPIFGLKEWQELLDYNATPRLSAQAIDALCLALAPGAESTLSGDLQNFQNFVEMSLVLSSQDRFHRVYRARRQAGREKLILHLYDLTAIQDKDPQSLARREFETLQRLQKAPWLPNLQDSFQEAAQCPGELCFFSYTDPEAPTLEERSRDGAWSTEDRIVTVRRSLAALSELHSGLYAVDQQPTLHRDLRPSSVRVRSNGDVLFTNLQAARLSRASTLAGRPTATAQSEPEFEAPEVRASGLEASTTASDIYSLCRTLQTLFDSSIDVQTARANEALQLGLEEDPKKRASIEEILAYVQVDEPARINVSPEAIPVDYWDEDLPLRFHDREYRIVTRLGSGGIGTAFKVMELDPRTREILSGPYVAKVVTNPDLGPQAIKAYNLVRAQTGTNHLVGVFEVAKEWRRGEISALLKWVEGQPLDEYRGLLELYCEDTRLDFCEETIVRWLEEICEGLAELHAANLVHGDLNPKNILIHQGHVTLIDFDLAGKPGQKPLGGTHHYCSENVAKQISVDTSDDVYAAAASVYSVLFDTMPFDKNGTGIDRSSGLNCQGPDQLRFPLLCSFFQKATDPDPSNRFYTAMDALRFLRQGMGSSDAASEREVLHENEVPWLGQLLLGYPGSLVGNTETRGLDSDFAHQTYVNTVLDDFLLERIRRNEVSCVILTGNAGDGKTAFVQHLAEGLGLPRKLSGERIWEHTLPEGVRIVANMDASAAHNGRSASELLNEFLLPFSNPPFPEKLIHLVAVNDGPLSAWLDAQVERTHLTKQIELALGLDGMTTADARLLFIDLNARSLVGAFDRDSRQVTTHFLDNLLEKMLARKEGHWQPCRTCTARERCQAWNSVQALSDQERGPHISNRLTRALQAVHHRGEIHITARSLRSALTYGFFGIHDCRTLHADPSLRPSFYYDRFFQSDLQGRQGDLLTELQHLDPGLGANPRVDRYLLQEGPEAPGDGRKLLRSLRRRAYFEMSDEKIKQIGGDNDALNLFKGSQLDAFRQAGIGTEEDRRGICRDLCRGMSRLEDLPDGAHVDPEYIPLKISQRTPTETSFWVQKPLTRFKLTARLPSEDRVLESLHTQLELSYEFANGHVEKLVVGAELFHLLMQLKEGFQLSDSLSDDVFANLAIFKQRLAQEDDRSLFGWSPLDEQTYRLTVESQPNSQAICVQAKGCN